MAQAFWMRVREVDWEAYSTSDGTSVPKLLRNLVSRKSVRSMKASQQAWVALCGGGEIHSAALPCIPFLVESLALSTPAVQAGVLDILAALGQREGGPKDALEKELEKLAPLRHSADQTVAHKVSDLLAMY